MTGFELATVLIGATQVAISAAAVAAILVGIRQMRHAGDQREKREDARHREAMQALAGQAEALRVLIERIGGNRG